MTIDTVALAALFAAGPDGFIGEPLCCRSPDKGDDSGGNADDLVTHEL